MELKDIKELIALIRKNDLSEFSLEQEGFTVRTFTDGESALQGINARPVDLAVLDIKMPRMDGMELLQRLRQRTSMPVIFLTSKDEEIDELFGLKMGADDFIRKPFSQRLLVERVKAVLRRSAPKDPAAVPKENDAKALAMEIVQKVRAGDDFCKLAEQYSDDPKTKQDCGTFGLVNATTSLPDNLKKVVLGLKQGEISDPIRDISGFYIVRVDGQVLRPLSDVFEPIVQELRQSHLDAYLKELQAKFQPQVLEQGFFLNPDDYMNRAREPIRK